MSYLIRITAVNVNEKLKFKHIDSNESFFMQNSTGNGGAINAVFFCFVLADLVKNVTLNFF